MYLYIPDVNGLEWYMFSMLALTLCIYSVGEERKKLVNDDLVIRKDNS